jgi:hypothetical protein
MTWWSWDDQGRIWRPSERPQEAFNAHRLARLVPLRAGRWALLARGAARVNGEPCLPIHILSDRDEISIAGLRFCIGIETPPAAEPFRAGTRTVRCARCLDGLVESEPAVVCPRCGAHHHAPCWTYDTRCQKCAFKTDCSAWTPEAPA